MTGQQQREHDARAALSAYRAVDPTGQPVEELLGDLQALLALRDQVDGLIARRLEVVEVSDATAVECGLSTRAWLQSVARLSAYDAGQRMLVGRSLASAPVLAEAVEDGAVGHDSARIIASTLHDLADRHRAPAERILVDLAMAAPPAKVAVAARQIKLSTFCTEQREEAEQRRLASRHLSIAATFGGMVAVSGLLDPVAGEALYKVINAMAAPAGPDDDRTPAQRRADALAEIARHMLGCPGLPDNGGDRPQVVVTLDFDTLREGVGGATLEQTGLDIGPAALRRVACDAGVIPAVLSGDGAVLDVGRSTRVWPTAIRRAARIRDGGCVFPGCTAALERCELHHIEFWSDGGATSLSNSAHVCLFHHMLVHERGWALRRVSAGGVVFTRPDGVDCHSPPLPRAG